MSAAPVWQSSDAELLAELGTLETQLHSTWAQMLSVVAEVDSRTMAPELGYRGTAELVRAIARIPRSEARARVNAAADVLPSRGVGGAPVEPKLPATAAAVADAAIGAADVAVIRSVLARIPHLGQDTRAEVEAELAHHARTLDAGQLAILGRRILATWTRMVAARTTLPRPAGRCASTIGTAAMSCPGGWIGKPPRSFAAR